MRKTFFVIIALSVAISSLSQTRIKVMAYNLMHYPGSTYYNTATGNYESRAFVLKDILDEYQPDIFMVSELKNSAGANEILFQSLATEDDRYQMAEFQNNHSSGYTELQQLVYYNSKKLVLTDQSFIVTNIRDINQYSFIINTEPQINIEVFVAHLKASNGVENEYKRLYMVEEFTDYLETIPDDTYVMIGGDFNFYSAYELGYRELLDEENSIRLVDPINSFGAWHNNSDYTDIHTQSPLQSNWHFHSEFGGSEGVTGGLDDRFDFILISENMQDGDELTYVPDTYKAYGNNGNCFNGDITDSDCDGEYSEYTRTLLHNMSDHLPVVMELETGTSVVTSNTSLTYNLNLIGSNYVNESIQLNIGQNLIGKEIEIHNQLGQLVLKQELVSENQKISISHLNAGLYYFSCPQISLHSPLKFIILD